MQSNNVECKKEIVKRYIRNNPNCTYRDIKKSTKMKVERIYKNMREAYMDAGVNLSKNLTKRNRDQQIKDTICFIKNNPGCTVTDIYKNIMVTIPRVFGTIKNAYRLAGIEYPKREIKDGIRNPLVLKRSRSFERKIIRLLSKVGNVYPKIKTSEGILDCLFEFNNKKYVVEIKDYRSRNNVTMSDIRQLIRYMQELNYKKGLLICPKESFPKKSNTRLCPKSRIESIISNN